MDSSTHQVDLPAVLALVERGKPLVDRIAKRIRRSLDSSYQLEDLIAAGTIGLLEASRRFDPGQGVPFEGFAYHRVQGEIYNEVGRSSQLKGSGYHKAVALEAALVSSGNDLCEAALQLASLADLSDLSEPEMESATDALLGSIATATAVGLLRPALESADVAYEFDVEEELDRRQLVTLIWQLLEELGPEDAEIFRKKHVANLTFRDISAELGLSRMAIHRRYARIIDYLQVRLRALRERGARPDP